MSLIKENIKSILSVEKELPLIANKAVTRNAEKILNILKDEQLRKSIMSDGGLAPYYKKSTLNFALTDNPITGASSKTDADRFNYEWTGEWMKDMYVRTESNDDGFNILSADGKTQVLEQMSGGKLTALTKENNEKVNDEIIKPALYERLFDRLLNF